VARYDNVNTCRIGLDVKLREIVDDIDEHLTYL